MDTKSLLYGIGGLLLGGLIVSIAYSMQPPQTDHAMNAAVKNLEKKQGDEFDKAFVSEMIMHHQAAVDMAKLSEQRAKHDELKQLSNEIITAQDKEIAKMKQWQAMWGYGSSMNH